MRVFFNDSTVVARFVADMLTDSRLDSALITIMIQAKSGGCSVSIVTDMSLAGIAERKAQRYSFRLTNISPLPTQDG